MGKWSVASDAALETRRAVEQRLFGRELTDRERKILGLRLGWADRVRTQQEVAATVGLSQPAISNIERGLVRDMDRKHKLEQEALRKLPESRALAKAVSQISEALEGIESLRTGDVAAGARA